jgi:hypothetical protein
MDIFFAVFRSVETTAWDDLKSMDARFINDYVVVVAFESGKTISKDCATIGAMVGIGVNCAIKADIRRARQTPMA